VAAESLGAVSVPVVHSATKAVLELFASGADAFLGPVSVAEYLELVFPDFVEIIGVYVALGEDIAVYVWAGADTSVYKNGCYIDSRVAKMPYRADFFLVTAKISLTAESNV